MYKISKIKKEIGKDKIIIFVDGWSSYKTLYYLMRESVPEEYGYIQYSYTDDVLSPNPIKTKANFLKLINTIIKDINSLNAKKERTFYMYGQSLGGLFCMIVADKVKIEKVKLIVPGYNLAEAFWLGDSTQELKESMVKKYSINLMQLKREWKEISPDNYFKNKSYNTEFHITLSKNDTVIPISNGKRLVKLLKDENIKVHVSWTELSHQVEMLKEGLLINGFRSWVKGF